MSLFHAHTHLHASVTFTFRPLILWQPFAAAFNLNLGQCSKELKVRLGNHKGEWELNGVQDKVSHEALQLIGLKFNTR